MAKYRKKPVVIDAWVIQDLMWAHKNKDLPEDIQQAKYECKVTFSDGAVYVETPEGRMRGGPESYLIKGVRGEFYPCRPEIFEATYEAAS